MDRKRDRLLRAGKRNCPALGMQVYFGPEAASCTKGGKRSFVALSTEACSADKPDLGVFSANGCFSLGQVQQEVMWADGGR